MSKSKFNVLVTGGAGFIGSHLTDFLVNAGHRVTVVDNLINGRMENLDQASKSPNFSFVKGDILDQPTVNGACNGVDIVFHLACLGVRHSLHSPFENHRVNAEGTLNVLEAARTSNTKHFFYISTSEIYGRTTSFPINELSETNPLTVYGSSKLAGEHYAHSYRECFGLRSTVLRIFNNYGPRAHYEGDAGEVIPRSIIRIMNNEQPVVYGTGSNTRDFFYVKDTARCLGELIAVADKLVGETINVGTGEEISIKSLVEALLTGLKKTDLGIKFLPDRPADVPRLWVDNRKFKRLTDFAPSYSFDEGIAETIEFYKRLPQLSALLKDVKETNWQKK
jgi:UDP-glucose 4-epimerase